MAQQIHKIKTGAKKAKNKVINLADLPLTGWLESKGWEWFPHQIETLQAAQKGKDVLLCAPTGAGKTLSGFLPSFVDLLSTDQHHGLHTLYISPLKALTVDVHRNVGKPIEELHLPITYETRTGDTPASKRTRQKLKPPAMLMTTPESLALLISYDNATEYFANLRFVIVDELHALMSSKRGDLLSLGLARLRTLAPHVQFIGLSATIPDPELALEWLSSNGVIVKAPMKTLPDIKIMKSEKRIPWSGHMATYAMPEIYEELAKSQMSIVFVNTRAQAELIFQNLWRINEKNLKIGLHHGSLDPNLRRKVEDSMARGDLDCVVATSSLDLGIDWAQVDLVVQIGAPKGISRLLQRIGRSNHRMNEPSRALLVPTNRFECIECQATVDAIAHKELDGTEARTGGLDVLAQHIFGTACAGPFNADQLYEEIFQAWPYHKISRTDFDQTLQFVSDGGYVLKNYERFKRLYINKDDLYELADPKMARQYRMNIGTIVEAPMLKVKKGKQYLGMIEEFFINHLTQGDTFLFAGSVVQFDGLRDATVMVTNTKSDAPKIPSYDGGKLPMSTHLSLRVREMLENPELWHELPENVEEWLELQQDQSLLPGADYLLVECFPRQGKFYTVIYPFAGRNAHQTLGFLLMRRMKRQGYKPLGFVATDYALAMCQSISHRISRNFFQSIYLVRIWKNGWMIRHY
jgi:ATP-dependent Lhr-like helicase